MLDETKWYLCYFGASWLCSIGHGLVVTVVGPTQPYIAQNVGVEIDIINLLWSFGFFGFLLGSIIAGFVFRRYCDTGFKKMVFLSVTMGFNGVVMVSLPFIKNFGLLVTARCLQSVALGASVTADCSLVVYTMGPVMSRPFTMAIHAMIGAGFLIATFLVKPFLPQTNERRSFEQVCGAAAAAAAVDDVTDDVVTSSSSQLQSEAMAFEQEQLWGVSKIAWPFVITGSWCVLFSFGYVFLGMLPLKMPQYYGEVEARSAPKIVYWKPLLVMTFFYYFITCGIERIYQPMAYTYGLCGPLRLSPSDAVVIDQSYNGGFMVGRITSIFVSKVVKPRTMVVCSLVTCIASSIVIVSCGTTSQYGVYAGTGLLGFFISWQYGSCYSWIAQKLDITGPIAPVFFIGCGAGGLVFPPLSGFVFTWDKWGPVGILHLTLIVCVIQCLVFAAMYAISRKRVQLDHAPPQLHQLEPMHESSAGEHAKITTL